MSTRRRDSARHRNGTVLGGAAILAIVAGMTWFAVPRASAASRAPADQRVTLTLKYTCAFPTIGQQPTTITIESDIPDSIVVGQSTAHYVVTAAATVPWELTVGLRALGVSTVTGTADGQASVEAPQGDFTETVPFDIPEITLPAVSSFTGDATGTAPGMTFSQPGHGEVVVGDFLVHLVPRDSSGNLTALGEPNVSCTLDSGQNDVAASFTITGSANPVSSSPTAGPSSRPAPAPTARSFSPRPSPSASGRAAVALPARSPSVPVRMTDAGFLGGGGTAWVIVAASLAALAAIGTLAFRYARRHRRRQTSSSQAGEGLS